MTSKKEYQAEEVSPINVFLVPEVFKKVKRVLTTALTTAAAANTNDIMCATLKSLSDFALSGGKLTTR
jgi:hypothetical protein